MSKGALKTLALVILLVSPCIISAQESEPGVVRSANSESAQDYLTLPELLGYTGEQLTEPCASQDDFEFLLEQIAAYEAVITNPEELKSDALLLSGVRALIVSAQESAREVQESFGALQQRIIAKQDAFVQIKSQTQLQTKVIQSIFAQQLGAIMAQISRLQRTRQEGSGDQQDSQDQTDPVVLAQNVIDAIDRLGADINSLLELEPEFPSLLEKLGQLKIVVEQSRTQCYSTQTEPESAEVQDVKLEDQPSSAVLDDLSDQVGEDSYRV